MTRCRIPWREIDMTNETLGEWLGELVDVLVDGCEILHHRFGMLETQ